MFGVYRSGFRGVVLGFKGFRDFQGFQGFQGFKGLGV